MSSATRPGSGRPLAMQPANDTRLTPDLGKVHNTTWSVVDRSTVFRSIRVRQLYDWWLAASGPGIPLRRSFDVTEHPAIIADLFLVSVLPHGQFKFKLQGERVRSLLGPIDIRRQIGPDSTEASDVDLAFYYEGLVRDGRPRLCVGDLGHRDRAFLRIESLDCPLSEDGVTVSAVIGVMDAV